ncbi:MAG: HAMP domain-containing sensor histidine kinase [Luteolibacter sp.]
MKTWSLKTKVGAYAALLTVISLAAGISIVMGILYYNQLSELDEDLGGEVKELFWDFQHLSNAPLDPNQTLSDEMIPMTLRNHYLMIRGPLDQLIYRSANLKGISPAGDVGRYYTTRIGRKNCRIGVFKQEGYQVTIGTSLAPIERFQKDLLRSLLIALPVIGLMVFTGGRLLGRRAVATVTGLTLAAERISATSPEERLPLPESDDEIARLTEVLNRSFDRLQTSYDAAIRFSADASHQLKTPVTILRAGLDQLSSEKDLTAAQSAEVAVLRQQTRRLTALIEDLLLLAQADAGRLQLEFREMDLKPMIDAALDDLQTLVLEQKITVEKELPTDLPTLGDRSRVRLVLQNLIENAAKYTDAGGRVKVRAFQERDWAVVRIGNSGGTIPHEDRERIFERFRRGAAVGENVRGHGLGLNIAREIVRAHGGELKLFAAEEGWTEFEFRLPAVPFVPSI